MSLPGAATEPGEPGVIAGGGGGGQTMDTPAGTEPGARRATAGDPWGPGSPALSWAGAPRLPTLRPRLLGRP